MIDPLKLRRFGLAIAIIAVFSLFLALYTCSKRQQDRTEAKIATGQAGAAIESGKDAVDTHSNRTASESAGRAIVEDTKDEIRNAGTGTDVDRAGRSGLCRLQGNRSKPECVQQPST